MSKHGDTIVIEGEKLVLMHDMYHAIESLKCDVPDPHCMNRDKTRCRELLEKIKKDIDEILK